MKRRSFLLALTGFVIVTPVFAKNKKFHFKIKTKSKSIVITMIEATDMDAAKVKLLKRYPDCQILSSSE